MLFYVMLSIILIVADVRADSVGNSTDDCYDLLNSFSLSLANFTNCSIVSARPITLCENCADSYFSILSTYKLLTTTIVNRSPCIDNFINLDRLQIVDSAYKNSINLWNKAKCFECVSFVNGTHISTKLRKDFQKEYEKFYNCTVKYTNNSQLCTNCVDKYIKLNNYYFSIGDITHGIDGLCMDIVDLMNKTQSKWSKTCCHYREKNELIYILTTVFMCILPILFYVLVKLFVDVKRPTLVPQNRLAESINTSNSCTQNE